MKTWQVGILLFNEVEVLDFAGPFEVLSLAEYPHSVEKGFQVRTVSADGKLIRARNGLQVQPDYSFASAPVFDLVIIPGGYGAEHIEINHANVINWIAYQAKQVEVLASVCTGAFLLAKAHLLTGKQATTHWMDIERLQALFPDIEVTKQRYIDLGTVITSGGISSGIDMALHIVSRFMGEEVAVQTARRMEYDISDQTRR